MTPNDLPERYARAVIPHIMVKGVSAAIDFYAAAFDATQLFRIAQPDGTIVHAEITVGGSTVMVGDAAGIFHDPTSSGPSVGLHMYVDDVDRVLQQAVHAGAAEMQPAQDMFYGARQAMILDPFGHVWVLLTQTEDLTPREIQDRGDALFSPREPSSAAVRS